VDAIAEEHVVLVSPSGKRIDSRIVVGRPTTGPENCWCECALEGIEPPYKLGGETTLQALSLALRTIRHRIEDLVSKGWRIVNDEGDDVPVDAILGHLNRGQEPQA
jgi:hypothetical protein